MSEDMKALKIKNGILAYRYQAECNSDTLMIYLEALILNSEPWKHEQAEAKKIFSFAVHVFEHLTPV